MGGSQLTQLKAALHSTGLAGERRKKKTQKGGQRKSGSFVDEDARKAKLEVGANVCHVVEPGCSCCSCFFKNWKYSMPPCSPPSRTKYAMLCFEQAIRQSMNRFDVKTTKTKHSVLGAKPAKGSTGRPGLSKQTGLENVCRSLSDIYPVALADLLFVLSTASEDPSAAMARPEPRGCCRRPPFR